MSGKTLIIEAHGWRGLHIDGGALGRVLIVGFVSVSYVPYLLTDWLKDRISKLRSVATHARVEMACADVDGLERKNPSFAAKFPLGIHKNGERS